MTASGKQPKRLNCAFLLALFGICASCGQLIPPPNRHLKQAVTEAEMLGQWSLISNSLALLKRDGITIPTKTNYGFTLESNSVLRFESIWDAAGGHQWLDVSGTWKLEHGDGSIGNPKNELVLRLNVKGKDWVFSLYFDRKKEGIILWNYHGDPDGLEYLEYVQPTVSVVK
jgi:hypothetical protein